MGSARDDLGTATREAAVDELDRALRIIVHCVGQLSEDQVWWRPDASMNSIANLLLHLCGNVRQWVLAAVGGADDCRDRPKEFSERGPIPKSELLTQLESTVTAARAVVLQASDSDLVQRHRIQGFEVSGIGAVLHSLAHFHGHMQEIVHMTRVQLGDDYRFDFVPSTPEQGTP